METADRFHALDALRAFALLLGIVLHTSLSFLPGLADLDWPIVDNSPSPLLGAVFYVIHIFRMTVFFLMAGFFARLMFHRQGAGLFFKTRMKRILIPLVAGWFVLMPLLLAAMVWGAAQLGKPLAPPSPPNGALLPFPLAHLWFLWLLFWFYPLFIGSRWMLLRLPGSGEECLRRADTVVRWISTTALGPILLALPLAIGLYQHEAWRTWEGIPAPDRALVPNLPALLAYGTAFGFGWLLHRQTHLLHRLARHWPTYLSAALILTAICIALGGSSPATAPPPLQGVRRMVYIGGYGVAVWCWTFALVGAAMRFLSEESPRRRYLSDSSYWLYLVHLPLIFGLQAMVMRWNLHWSVKFSLIMAVATPNSYSAITIWSGLPGWACCSTDAAIRGRRGPRHPNGW